MIQIGNTLISLDVFEKKFSCDLEKCKGACCIEGDSGAPLEESEEQLLRENYEGFKSYMTENGIKAVEEQGFAVIDRDGDLVTPLIAGCECAYAIDEDGSCWCAVEKAWTEGKSRFRKPVSCHLYPVRVTRYPDFEALNFNKWKICSCAVKKGEKLGIPVYRFVKDALIVKYGQDWYDQLEIAAHELETGGIQF